MQGINRSLYSRWDLLKCNYLDSDNSLFIDSTTAVLKAPFLIDLREEELNNRRFS